MASQNINQYVYPNVYPKFTLDITDISLTSDETGFNQEVVFSPYLIAQTYGNKLPIYFDTNDPNTIQSINLEYGVYNPNNIFISQNYYNPHNIDLSCEPEGSSCDIGLTGIDNGLVTGMTGQTIYFTNGIFGPGLKFNRQFFDRRFKMFQVTGHTDLPNTRFSGFSDSVAYEVVNKYSNYIGNYHELYGGFYQGFYKLHGYNYDIFPERMNKGWTVEMILKPRFVNEFTPPTGRTTLNQIYPENKDIFFYLGARAENKFYHHADGTPNCFTGYTRITNGLEGIETCACCNKIITDSRCIYVYPPRSINGIHDPHTNYGCNICNGDIKISASCGCGCSETRCLTCGWECQTHTCSQVILPTPTPTPSPTPAPSECITLPSCEVCTTCQTCDTCNDCAYSGFSSIEDTCEKDPMWDAISNNLAIKLCGDPKNPSIGVRVLRFTGDCENIGSCQTSGVTFATGYTVVEYCSPPIYPYCEAINPAYLDEEHWFQVDVVWERNTWLDYCDLKYRGGLDDITETVSLQSLANNSISLIAPPYTRGTEDLKVDIIQLNEKWLLDSYYRKGKLKIYVNGRIIYTIDDFEEVIPRALNTDKEKQVGVPFNISWGGGTQGLRENLTFNQKPECDIIYGVEIDLSLDAVISPGSINIQYILTTGLEISDEITVKFIHNLGRISGGFFTVESEVVISPYNISGETIIVLDEDYYDLNGVSEINVTESTALDFKGNLSTNTNTEFVQPTFDCKCILFQNNSPEGAFVNFKQCDGKDSILTILPGQYYFVCGSSPYSSNNGVIITIYTDCINGECQNAPTPTLVTKTPTPTPSITPSSTHLPTPTPTPSTTNPCVNYLTDEIGNFILAENGNYIVLEINPCITPTPTNTITPTPTITPSPTNPCVQYLTDEFGNFILTENGDYIVSEINPCISPTPTNSETPTSTPTLTPTNTPTTSPVYYYYYLLDCDYSNNKYGRSIYGGLTGVFNVDVNKCYTIVGSDLGPNYDYDLDLSTLVSDCLDPLCVIPVTPTPTPSQTPNSPSLSYRYLRWTITKKRTASDSAVQAANLVLVNNGIISNWDSGATAVSPDSVYAVPTEDAQQLVDLNENTKWCDIGYGSNQVGVATIYFDNGFNITFNSYYYTTGNDLNGRDPISWTIEVSDDNTNWILVDTVVDAIITIDRYTPTQTFYIVPPVTPTPTITPTITPEPTSTPTTTPAIYYYSVNGYGCGTPCYNVGQFVVKSPIPLTIGYFYNNPENRGYTFEILTLIPETPTDYDLTNEPGYSDCTVACYPPSPTPTQTQTQTPTVTPSTCIRNIVVPTLYNGGTSINSNQLQLTQTSETLLIQINDTITDFNGSTSFVGYVSSNGTYTYVGTGPGGGVAFNCQFPLTFSGPC